MSAFQIGDDGDFLVQKGKLVLEKDPFIAGAVKLRNRFLFFRGEWFLDTREGVPYFQVVLVKQPNLDVIRRLFMSIIKSVETIDSVTKCDVYFLPETRELAMEFEAFGKDGQRLEGGLGKPFLVNGVEIPGAKL